VDGAAGRSTGGHGHGPGAGRGGDLGVRGHRQPPLRLDLWITPAALSGPPPSVPPMPSGEHESQVALAKLDPDLVAWLLANVFDVKVPDYHHARTQATDVRVLVPRTYHADGMLVFCDSTDRPLLAVVLEIQRKPDRAKRRTWKLYVAQLEAELDVGVALLVYCPDLATARWHEALFEPDWSSLSLRPMIFTPDDVPLVVDTRAARENPALAVLPAICHGRQPDVDATFPALVSALRSLEPKIAILYHDVVLAGLPSAARARWEAFMTSLVNYEFLSDRMRQLAAEAKAQAAAEVAAEVQAKVAEREKVGRAGGEAYAILAVLEERAVPVPAEVREQILGCTDLARLDAWLRRAVRADTIEDVIRG